MKRLFYILVLAGTVAGCSKGPWEGPSRGDAPAEVKAIVTVKQDADGTTFFQLDDDTRVYPSNFAEPYTGLRRIVCGLLLSPDMTGCTVQWYDALEQGTVSGDALPETAVSDGVEVLEDWMTSVEDGFLTVHYSAWWGDGHTPHQLLVLTRLNPENPYELTLVHQRNGDEALRRADSLIYFDINDLPSTQGDYVTLTLNWKNLDGEDASKNFRFRNRQ